MCVCPVLSILGVYLFVHSPYPPFYKKIIHCLGIYPYEVMWSCRGFLLNLVIVLVSTFLLSRYLSICLVYFPIPCVHSLVHLYLYLLFLLILYAFSFIISLLVHFSQSLLLAVLYPFVPSFRTTLRKYSSRGEAR